MVRLLFLVVLLASSASAQRVPEGIHRETRGPPTLCGIKGADLAAIQQQVLEDRRFVEEGSTDLYRVFNRDEDFTQFVFPQPGTLSYPMATCRKVVSNPDGSSSIRRELQCEASREECDNIFLQFNALDQRVGK